MVNVDTEIKLRLFFYLPSPPDLCKYFLYILFIYPFVYLFIYFERDSASGGGAEREEESEAGSALSA